MTRGFCDVVYRPPGRQASQRVDAALEHRVLDRLNVLPGLRVYAVCAGHRRGPGDREAHVIFQPKLRSAGLLVFEVYLRRCGATEYAPVVTYYNGRWHMELRREETGEAPRSWWYGLVNVLFEHPDCRVWL